jgi:hypothetical protein
MAGIIFRRKEVNQLFITIVSLKGFANNSFLGGGTI